MCFSARLARALGVEERTVNSGPSALISSDLLVSERFKAIKSFVGIRLSIDSHVDFVRVRLVGAVVDDNKVILAVSQSAVINTLNAAIISKKGYLKACTSPSTSSKTQYINKESRQFATGKN